jgi:hypothetical protein
MERFIGVKEIKAKPMTRQEYNDYRGWELPEDENGADPGYLVEYIDGGQTNHPGHDGYISWSPAGVFDRAYRAVTGMTFGLAIEAMKKGHKVRLHHWKGDVFLSIRNPSALSEMTHPYIYVTSRFGLVPWVATQVEMLAEDWMIVD